MTVHYQNLVSCQLLAENISNPLWVVLDCRFDLADITAGRARWAESHIPGAHYADLEKDLSAPATGTGGRHPLPDAATMAQRFSDWGIGPQSQVVAYDDVGGAFAARAWWLARWLGHEHVAVLDGGMTAWREAGLPLSDDEPARRRGGFTPHVDASRIVDAKQLADALARGAIVLDARVAARFLGDHEPLDARAGHVPGAHNHPYAANLDHRGRFLPADELRAFYDAARGSRPAEDVICMCGSGVTACHNLLAMAIAGLDGARLYPGSWSEWSADATRPVATGPDA